jgi:hypothetical protein
VLSEVELPKEEPVQHQEEPEQHQEEPEQPEWCKEEPEQLCQSEHTEDEPT